MNTKQLTALSLRVVAIWMLIQVCMNMPGIINYFLTSGVDEVTGNDGFAYLAVVSSSILSGLICAYFIFKISGKIAQHIDDVDAKPFNKNAEAFLIQLVGLYFLVDCVSTLPSEIYFAFFSAISSTAADSFWISGSVLQSIISFAMIFKPNLFITVFRSSATK
ncbi:hypothetical protein [Pseudoalteromonas piscicida]|uniref:hypothetical protein n=1 Tax=Pseudoalteromonas piscicida TaxID=43662 RepID=UPI0005F9CEDD|nr:hypothetical protein [Pseudoalteromonas piscicida]KJZ02955.1 hypothetical protein TW73_10040 [Pseudoalteromonas piscicida]